LPAFFVITIFAKFFGVNSDCKNYIADEFDTAATYLKAILGI
jgi:hypothetical protein